jgi:hypothetical protein
MAQLLVARLPPQRQVTKQIMTRWTLHKQMHRHPPNDRILDVHMHHAQSLPMLVCVCVCVVYWYLVQ